MLLVETRVLGRKSRPLDRWSVPVPPEPGVRLFGLLWAFQTRAGAHGELRIQLEDVLAARCAGAAAVQEFLHVLAGPTARGHGTGLLREVSGRRVPQELETFPELAPKPSIIAGGASSRSRPRVATARRRRPSWPSRCAGPGDWRRSHGPLSRSAPARSHARCGCVARKAHGRPRSAT